jgi:hypothetical protein
MISGIKCVLEKMEIQAERLPFYGPHLYPSLSVTDLRDLRESVLHHTKREAQTKETISNKSMRIVIAINLKGMRVYRISVKKSSKSAPQKKARPIDE